MLKISRLNVVILLASYQTLSLYNPMKNLFKLVLITAFLFLNTLTTPILSDTINNGVEVFQKHCAGCHINGGNIVRRGKNLKLSTLQKYHLDSVEAIASLVTNGKNNMSPYKDRLTTEEIQQVATYVLQQAAQGWP